MNEEDLEMMEYLDDLPDEEREELFDFTCDLISQSIVSVTKHTPIEELMSDVACTDCGEKGHTAYDH